MQRISLPINEIFRYYNYTNNVCLLASSNDVCYYNNRISQNLSGGDQVASPISPLTLCFILKNISLYIIITYFCFLFFFQMMIIIFIIYTAFFFLSVLLFVFIFHIQEKLILTILSNEWKPFCFFLFSLSSPSPLSLSLSVTHTHTLFLPLSLSLSSHL